MRISLQTSITATFGADSAGGTVARTQIGPTVYGSEWDIKRVVVSTTSSGLNGSSRFYMYLNSESPSALLDGTYSGDQDVNETSLHLRTGDNLICVWTGGDDGAIATAIIIGEVETGR